MGRTKEVEDEHSFFRDPLSAHQMVGEHLDRHGNNGAILKSFEDGHSPVQVLLVEIQIRSISWVERV